MEKRGTLIKSEIPLSKYLELRGMCGVRECRGEVGKKLNKKRASSNLSGENCGA